MNVETASHEHGGAPYLGFTIALLACFALYLLVVAFATPTYWPANLWPFPPNYVYVKEERLTPDGRRVTVLEPPSQYDRVNLTGGTSRYTQPNVAFAQARASELDSDDFDV